MRSLYFFFLLAFSCGFFQFGYAQNKNIDVQHYRFEIALNDTTNIIAGKAVIRFIPKTATSSVYFDLIGKKATTETGMRVNQVKAGNKKLRFNQKRERLYFHYSTPLKPGKTETITITYAGIPADGLIISKNKYGQRTFFADNWPERAHHWIPTNDHPSDKAKVDFLITAPSHYQVVANGRKVEETSLADHQRLTHWKTALAIPTKVMAIGVADFAVQQVDRVHGIPIQTWVFAQNKEAGFKEYAVSKNILPFYIDYIGKYPYKKLANVQSKTRFGGLENASSIFYSEQSVYTDALHSDTKQYELEALMAHETAHQWFGDQASETDWPQLWLSEGFASYMPDLYFESRYGKDTLKARLARDRHIVIDFSKTRNTPVVDTTTENPMELLNPNSYQKGAWVLHMLRRKLGDSIFQEGIRSYYKQYKGKNASTEDFKKIMEKCSGQNLETFFKQWLHTPGQPKLKIYWQYNQRKEMLVLEINQKQKEVFKFPLTIKLTHGDKTISKQLDIHQKNTTKEISVPFAPQEVTIDPEVNLLYEGTVEKK